MLNKSLLMKYIIILVLVKFVTLTSAIAQEDSIQIELICSAFKIKHIGFPILEKSNVKQIQYFSADTLYISLVSSKLDSLEGGFLVTFFNLTFEKYCFWIKVSKADIKTLKVVQVIFLKDDIYYFRKKSKYLFRLKKSLVSH